MVFPFSVILCKWLSEDSDILFMWCLSYLMITHKCCLWCKMLGLRTVTNWSAVFFLIFGGASCVIIDDSLNLSVVRDSHLFFFIRRELFTVYQLLKQVCIYWSGQGDLESCSPMIFAVSTMWNHMCSLYGTREKICVLFLSFFKLCPLHCSAAVFDWSKEDTRKQ